jgi:hypothetical protein
LGDILFISIGTYAILIRSSLLCALVVWKNLDVFNDLPWDFGGVRHWIDQELLGRSLAHGHGPWICTRRGPGYVLGTIRSLQVVAASLFSGLVYWGCYRDHVCLALVVDDRPVDGAASE